MAKRKMLKYDRACNICGTTPIYGDKFCDGCKREAKNRRRSGSAARNWFGNVNYAEQRIRRANRIAQFIRCCEACGGFFDPPVPSQRQLKGERDWGRFCSIVCRDEPQRQQTQLRGARTRILKLLGLRRECAQCGGIFTAKVLRQIYCSQACREHIETETRTCKECGRRFAALGGTGRSTFCSDECLRKCNLRVNRQRRKAKVRGAKTEAVNAIKVFERDGYRCQLCGYKTLKAKRGTYHPKAPELDHIQPLARGGEHSYRNTQCACRACNHAKRDGAGGQLLLIGEHV